MITWLQKNKKYSYIAVWVSTIAFVGAGFVGWGAYDYNSNRANAVASVGNEKITLKELQLSYNRIFNYYNELSGGKLTKEQAKEFKLESKALQTLIDQAITVNIAHDFGFSVTDEEVIENLQKNQEFQTDGFFDKTKYYNILKNANFTPKDYEKELEKIILVEKLVDLLDINATQLEKETIYASNNIQDKLEISIVSPKFDSNISDFQIRSRWESSRNLYMSLRSFDILSMKIKVDDVNVTDEELKKYFENNKNIYKTSDFESVKSSVTKDLQFSKAYKTAKLKYLKLKKGKLEFNPKIQTIDVNSDFDISKFDKKSVGDILKPLKVYDGYVVAKISAINLPKPLSFENAKKHVKADLQKELFKQELEVLSKKRLKDFNGIDIGFVSLSDSDIAGLNTFESRELIKQVFATPAKEGYKIFNNKSVVYKITDQKLLDVEDMEKQALVVKSQIDRVKVNLLKQNLITMYKDKYLVQKFR